MKQTTAIKIARAAVSMPGKIPGAFRLSARIGQTGPTGPGLKKEKPHEHDHTTTQSPFDDRRRPPQERGCIVAPKALCAYLQRLRTILKRANKSPVLFVVFRVREH